MPFTGSHPAAVLPLVRLGLPPSALVIGSMVPDLPYYLPAPVGSGTTHSLTGVVAADPLLGLAVLAVWHALLAPFAVAIGPAAFRGRLHPPTPRHARPAIRAVLLVVALAAGAATHVAWDSFTHIGRWGPAHIAWLAESHAGVPGYRWAQYAGGVVGAAAIALWLARWWRTTPATARRPAAPRVVAVASWTLIALAAATGALVAAFPALRDTDLREAGFLAITRGGGAALVTALLCALLTLRARLSLPS